MRRPGKQTYSAANSEVLVRPAEEDERHLSRGDCRELVTATKAIDTTMLMASEMIWAEEETAREAARRLEQMVRTTPAAGAKSAAH